MGDIPIASTALRLLIAATVVVQLGLLWAAPVPSPVATRRMVGGGRGPEGFAPKGKPAPDPPAALLLPLAALIGLAAVVAAVLQTAVLPALVPAGTLLPAWSSAASGAILVLGNALVASAALTLRNRTRFDGGGQSDVLITDGVFALTRHPIVIGLGLIYLGFLLALPSPLVLMGLIGYGAHQRRRLIAEEALLEKRFGQAYRDYRRRVGILGPRRPVASKGR